MTVTMTKRHCYPSSITTRVLKGDTSSLPPIAESGSRHRQASLPKKPELTKQQKHQGPIRPTKRPFLNQYQRAEETSNSPLETKKSEDMFPQHTPCFLTPRNATMVIAFVSIVYGILTVVTAAISLTTGQDDRTGTDEKSQLFRLIQYSTIGVGAVFVLFSGMLVFGVRAANRFLHLPWLFWTAIQILAIFVGAILIFVSLKVTASMIFSLVFNMIVGAIFCYCFLVVYEHYKHLVHISRPDAVRYEKEILSE